MPSKKQEFVKWSRREFVPTHEWPHAISNLLSQERISNQERYKSFCFFYGNGIDPNKIRDFMYCFNLDKEAKRHVEYLIKNKKTNWKYWDVTDRHSKTFRGTNIKIKAAVEPINIDPFPNVNLRDPRGPLQGGGPDEWRVPDRGEARWALPGQFDMNPRWFWDPSMQ